MVVDDLSVIDSFPVVSGENVRPFAVVNILVGPKNRPRGYENIKIRGDWTQSPGYPYLHPDVHYIAPVYLAGVENGKNLVIGRQTDLKNGRLCGCIERVPLTSVYDIEMNHVVG